VAPGFLRWAILGSNSPLALRYGQIALFYWGLALSDRLRFAQIATKIATKPAPFAALVRIARTPPVRPIQEREWHPLTRSRPLGSGVIVTGTLERHPDSGRATNLLADSIRRLARTAGEPAEVRQLRPPASEPAEGEDNFCVVAPPAISFGHGRRRWPLPSGLSAWK
jgi:hypothetical protein